jgi:small-conductance mechanosensitive channel
MINNTMPSSKLMIAGGKILPVLQMFAVSREDLQEIYHRLYQAVHPGDLIVLTLVSVGVVPIFSFLFGCGSDGDKPNHSYLYQFASHVSQAAKLAIVVYAFDCMVLVLTSLGFSFSSLSTYSKGFAKILYICWMTQRLSVLKRYLLGRAVSRKPDKLGRAATADRLLDGMLFLMTGFFLLDVLDVDMGVGITSVFAFGSAGTLVIGLASQNLATMFVNGLVLTTSDRIAEGDHIKFGNGNNGKVTKIGWFQTTLKHYDELSEVIPNSELGMQRVTNLSRVKKCRIRQILRFSYDDADTFDTMLPAILEEIKAACPKVITDGSAPFRAYWTNFKEDHLQGK